MRCKPGDLAAIVRTPKNWSKLLGRMIKVTEIVENDAFGNPAWSYEGSPLLSDDGIWEATSIPDMVLRPIRDPGDDAADQFARTLEVSA